MWLTTFTQKLQSFSLMFLCPKRFLSNTTTLAVDNRSSSLPTRAKLHLVWRRLCGGFLSLSLSPASSSTHALGALCTAPVTFSSQQHVRRASYRSQPKRYHLWSRETVKVHGELTGHSRPLVMHFVSLLIELHSEPSPGVAHFGELTSLFAVFRCINGKEIWSGIRISSSNLLCLPVALVHHIDSL